MLPGFPGAAPLGEADGLPASELSLGIITFNFGRMPADLGSAMLLLRESGGDEVDRGCGGGGGGGGGGGAADVTGGAGADAAFSSALAANAFFLWMAPTSMEWDRDSCPKPKCAASTESLGPIGVNMLRDFVGGRFGSNDCGSGREGCSFSGVDCSGLYGGIDCRRLGSLRNESDCGWVFCDG
jgi:hypothetical protein